MVEKEVEKITVSRGDTHTFLGMRITFNKNGTVSVDMSDYIIEVLQDFPDKLNKSATSPARPNLFEIDHSSPLLSEKTHEVFHSLVIKLMWVSQRCRLDISTRVSKATEQDWVKLKRVLEFLNGTVHDVLTLGAESLEELLNFVDVSFANHHDMRSHTGGGGALSEGECSCACQENSV